jgi:hypothetical protein
LPAAEYPPPALEMLLQRIDIDIYRGGRLLGPDYPAVTATRGTFGPAYTHGSPALAPCGVLGQALDGLQRRATSLVSGGCGGPSLQVGAEGAAPPPPSARILVLGSAACTSRPRPPFPASSVPLRYYKVLVACLVRARPRRMSRTACSNRSSLSAGRRDPGHSFGRMKGSSGRRRRIEVT